MIFELREYDIIPGFMPEWIKLMQEKIRPFANEEVNMPLKLSCYK